MPSDLDPAKAAFDAAFSTPAGAESSVFDAAGLTPPKPPVVQDDEPSSPAASVFDAAGLQPAEGPETDESLAARFAQDPTKNFSPDEIKRIRAVRDRPMTGEQLMDLPGKVLGGIKDTWNKAQQAGNDLMAPVHQTYETEGYWPALKKQFALFPKSLATLAEGFLRNESAIGTPIKHGIESAAQNLALATTDTGEQPVQSTTGALVDSLGSPLQTLRNVAAAKNPEAEQAQWLQREREKYNEEQLLARQPAVPGAVPAIADAVAYASPGALGPVAKGASLIGKAEQAMAVAKVGRLARISEEATARAAALTEEMEGVVKTAKSPEEITAAMQKQASAQKFAQSADARLRAAAAPLVSDPAKVGQEFSDMAAGAKPGTKPVLTAVGKGLQSAGQAGEQAVDAALGKIEPALDVFHDGKGTLNTLGLGALAHFVIPSHILELGGKGLAAMTSARFGTKLVSRYGELLQKLGQADWKSSISVWRQLAKDVDAPAWLKTAVSSGEGTNLRAMAADTLETGVRGVGSTLQDAAHGAAVAAGASLIDSDSTAEEKANFIAQGAAGGAIGGRIMSGFTSKAQAKAAMFHDVLQTADQAIKNGSDPIAVMRVAPSTLFYANALKHLFQGALPGGKSLDIKLLDGNQYKALGAKGVAFYQPETGTAVINADAPDSSGRLLHETLGHALWNSAVANRPEIAQRIREALSAHGATAGEAELQYALKLNPRTPGEQDGPYQQRISQYVANERTKSQAEGDPDLWILGELHADSAARALGGDNILDLSSPVFWDRLGDKTIASPSRSIFSGNVLKAIDSLHDLPRRQLRELGAFRPGIDQPAEQKIPINLETFGKHPGAPLHDLGQGIVGNDFVQQTPDGRVVPRPPSQVKKIIVERQHEVDAAVPLTGKVADAGDPDPTVKLRRTPAGRIERSGTVFGKWIDTARSFGNHTKKFIHELEDAIKNGKTMSGFYQAVGKGHEWAASVARTTGSLTAEHMDFIPYRFRVDSKGNALVDNYSLNAFERKAREWSAREGDVSLGMWTGDIGTFREDVKTYLKNHAEGLPGETGIGSKKRDLINAFLTGVGNRSMEAKNPLREHLKGNDRKGIVRSFRMDRIETLEPSTIEGFNRPEYGKQLENFSPRIEPKFSPSTDPRAIAGAAVQDAEGNIWRGIYHGEAIDRAMIAKAPRIDGYSDPSWDVPYKVGFVTNSGEYLSRDDAYKRGMELKQLSEDTVNQYMDQDGVHSRAFRESKFSPAPTMDTARRIAEMSPEDLMVHAKNFNNINIELGRSASPQDVAELRQLKARAEQRLNEVRAKAMAGDEKSLNDYAILSTLPQFFNEALAEAGKDGRVYSPNPDVAKISDEYLHSVGLKPGSMEDKPVDEARAKAVADWYQNAKHDPNNPHVAKAYDALSKETIAQWNAITKAGYTLEPVTTDPYKSSAEMLADVAQNKHLAFFLSGNNFQSDHPLMRPSGITVGNTPLLVNDVFRAVHDFFGHAKEGYQFGPRGEYNAFREHSRMFSEAARPALAAETLAQNAWVNFGPHLRDAQGNIPKKGEAGFVPPQARPFAEQKATTVPENLQFSPESSDNRPTDPENRPVWRSNILDALSSWQGKGTPAQLRAHLAKFAGTSEEAKWTGLDDFLKDKPRVTTEEVKKFIDENRVELKEVRLGEELKADPKQIEALKEGLTELDQEHYYREPAEEGYEPSEKQIKKLQDVQQAVRAALAEEDWSRVRNRLDRAALMYDDMGYDTRRIDKLAALASELESQTDGTGGNAPKYSDRTLPGGEKYREILFQVPAKQQEPPLRKQYQRWVNGELTSVGDENAQGRWNREPRPGQEIREVMVPHTQAVEKAGMFQSGHWDEPNVVAHSRVNDRVDSEGKPGLFVEEIQSDWHQKGRKEGYASDQKLDERGVPVGWTFKPTNVVGMKGREWDVYNTQGQRVLGGLSSEAEALEIVRGHNANGNAGNVPDAPFKKNWQEMVFRRLVREAVDTGKDWIGWTTGDQQADRYDLSKQVDSIYARKREPITVTGVLYPSTYSILVTEKGKSGLTEIAGAAKEHELEGLVGKELAQKIIVQNTGTSPVRYDGNDLKIGGAGMKGFYDKMIVDYARKFGKKFGAEVRDREVKASEDKAPLRVELPNGVDVPFTRLRDADDYVSRHGGVVYGPRHETVHSLDITPEMRESVKQGVQMFSPPTMEEWESSQKKSPMQKEEDRRFKQIDGKATAKKSGTGWILPDGTYAGATGPASVQNAGDFHIGWLNQNGKKYGIPKTDDPRLAALNKGFVRVRMENNGDLHVELNRRFWKAGVKDTVKEIAKDAKAWGVQVNFMSPSGKLAGSFYDKSNDLSFSPPVDEQAPHVILGYFNGERLKTRQVERQPNGVLAGHYDVFPRDEVKRAEERKFRADPNGTVWWWDHAPSPDDKAAADKQIRAMGIEPKVHKVLDYQANMAKSEMSSRARVFSAPADGFDKKVKPVERGPFGVSNIEATLSDNMRDGLFAAKTPAAINNFIRRHEARLANEVYGTDHEKNDSFLVCDEAAQLASVALTRLKIPHEFMLVDRGQSHVWVKAGKTEIDPTEQGTAHSRVDGRVDADGNYTKVDSGQDTPTHQPYSVQKDGNGFNVVNEHGSAVDYADTAERAAEKAVYHNSRYSPDAQGETRPSGPVDFVHGSSVGRDQTVVRFTKGPYK